MQSESATKRITRVINGFAILINHWDFVGNELVNRDGTKKDKRALWNQLERFGFKIYKIQDATKQKLKEELQEIVDKKLDHAKCDCILIAVMTHGKGGKLYAKDLELYSVDEDLLAPLKAKKELAEIPKIFVIQACRGVKRDTGHTVSPINACPPESFQFTSADSLHTDAEQVTPGDDCSLSQDSQEEDFSASLHPDQPNILVAYSTTKDYVSYRHSKTGTLYVQSLCEVLQEVADNKEIDVTRLFTNVHRRVTNIDAKERSEETLKQAPSFSSSLITKVLLKAKPVNEIPTGE